MIELFKLSIGVYFSIAKMHGATEAELDAIYQSEKDKFDQNNPIHLEEV